MFFWWGIIYLSQPIQPQINPPKSILWHVVTYHCVPTETPRQIQLIHPMHFNLMWSCAVIRNNINLTHMLVDISYMEVSGNGGNHPCQIGIFHEASSYWGFPICGHLHIIEWMVAKFWASWTRWFIQLSMSKDFHHTVGGIWISQPANMYRNSYPCAAEYTPWCWNIYQHWPKQNHPV